MTAAEFRLADCAETRTLPSTRPGWRGGPLAEVCVGQLRNGRWIHGGSVTLPSGAHMGWPLGRWTDSREVDYESEAEAWQDGMLRVARWIDREADQKGATRETRMVKGWALMMGKPTLQADLFA